MPREPFDNATPSHPTPLDIRAKMDAAALAAMERGIHTYLMSASTAQIDAHSLARAALDGLKGAKLIVRTVMD